jgi:hypothetical protein
MTSTRWLAPLLLTLVLLAPVSAAELPIMEAGRRIGVVRYTPQGGPGRASGTMAYIQGVAEAVLASRRSLAAMEWPLARQPAAFVIDVSDLGPDRLGVTTIDGRVRVTIQDRLADPQEDFHPRLKATVAHEYFHLCQYACWSDRSDASEPQYLWWMEACALYFEHRVAPRDRGGKKVLTYTDALPDARGAHGRAGLESPGAGSTLGYCYAPLAFLLAKGYGPEFLSRTWMRILEAPVDGPSPSAREAIEATLAEYGAGAARSRFEHVFREYVLYMMSPAARWVRTELGLDVIERLAIDAPDAKLDLDMPGWSFRVYRPQAGARLDARLSGDGLRAYLVGADGASERIRRVDGSASLALGTGESGWLVVINATAETRAAQVAVAATPVLSLPLPIGGR